MKFVVSGGTGFLGRPLAERLASDGHKVIVLTRGGGRTEGTHEDRTLEEARWNPEGESSDWSAVFGGVDVVINLAGESIAGRRWTDAQKLRIRESRIQSTRALVEAMRRAQKPPALFVSGSAVGYYGSRGDELLNERSAPGKDFLAEVCIEWETEAKKAADFARVVLVRTGIVLDRDGGALQQMILPFKVFAG